MSLFKKPKKAVQIQRRICNTYEDDNGSDQDGDDTPTRDQQISSNSDKSDKKDKDKKKKDKKEKKDEVVKAKSSLLSFADDEEEDGEIFQVKKSSHSKKVMRMLDKERRKKKNKDGKYDNGDSKQVESTGGGQAHNNNSDKIQTEIRTDDFVLVVKKSEPPENVILNGRAALCAGRNDMSSEDEDDSQVNHRFSKPDNFKLVLESGSIPDAAMIHAARKRRQRAREQGDFVPLDENKETAKKGKRLMHDDGDDDDASEDERVDMNAITGVKEREERREKFYSVQQECDDSDQEMNEWENQQIRKGVTGAQLVTAQQESVLSQFMIKSASSYDDNAPKSTASLLEQAYAKSSLEKPRQMLLSTQKAENKTTSLRTPAEIADSLRNRLNQIKELNSKHEEEITRISNDLKTLKLDAMNCEQKAPVAAAKYRFYQELRGYVTDLVECFDEKVPLINDMEKRALNILSKHATFLIERRRQDVTDQAKEVAESCKPASARKAQEDEDQIRRAAEREGRRTRRRCEREKNDYMNSHLDGMSSDDELPDQEVAQYQHNLDQIEVEASDLFHDACEDFYEVENILSKFNVWRVTDMDSYKDAFVSLCLPKIIGTIIRIQMLVWNPLSEDYKDIEKMDWYTFSMRYGWSKDESEESLALDPDVRLVPAIIEKIILPKLTEIIESCWDPLSSSQTLRVIGLIRRLVRDYPSLKLSSKYLRTMFQSIVDKMKTSLDNDVFIPIFPKQMQEAKTSFFQRQFCVALKFFRNILSWQGIIGDHSLKELAISSLLNKYLLSAMRVCTPTDAISKAYIVVNTLPTVWLQQDSEILSSNLQLFVSFLKHAVGALDRRNPLHIDPYDKGRQALQRLHNFS